MSTKTNKKESWDSSENEVTSNWVKFNVIGEDKVMGTLTAKRTMKSFIPGKEGEMVNIYDLKADVGSFHETDEKKQVIPEPVVIEEGSMWTIGGKPIIDRQMINVKVGQKVGFKFTEEVASKTKGFAPAKVIKVYTPKNDDGSFKMDTEWIEQNNSASTDPLKDM